MYEDMGGYGGGYGDYEGWEGVGKPVPVRIEGLTRKRKMAKGQAGKACPFLFVLPPVTNTHRA